MINPLSPTAAVTDFRGDAGRVTDGQTSRSSVDFEDVMHQNPSEDPDHIEATDRAIADAAMSDERPGEDATSDDAFMDGDAKRSHAQHPLGAEDRALDFATDDRQSTYGLVDGDGPTDHTVADFSQTHPMEQGGSLQFAASAEMRAERNATGDQAKFASGAQTLSDGDLTRHQPAAQSVGLGSQLGPAMQAELSTISGPQDASDAALPPPTGAKRAVRGQLAAAHILRSAPVDRLNVTMPVQQAPGLQYAQGMTLKTGHASAAFSRLDGDPRAVAEPASQGFAPSAAHPTTAQTLQPLTSPQAPPAIGLAPQVPTLLSARDQNTGASHVSLGDDLTLSLKSGDVSPGQLPSTNPSTVSQARPVLIQIVQFAPQPGQNAVEISLTPEELGKVRLSMVTTETTLVLTISAERSETLDLLRRHSAELGQEFSALGYDTIDFQFDGQGDSPANPDDVRPLGLEAATGDQPVDSSNALAAYVTGSGVDIRI